MARVMHAICHWVVTDGLLILRRCHKCCDMDKVESCDLVMALLVHGMMDVACGVLSDKGVELTSDSRRSLESSCRTILGSIQGHARKYNLDKGLASQFQEAWKQLRSARDKALRDAKAAQHSLKSQVQHCQPAILLAHICSLYTMLDMSGSNILQQYTCTVGLMFCALHTLPLPRRAHTLNGYLAHVHC